MKDRLLKLKEEIQEVEQSLLASSNPEEKAKLEERLVELKALETIIISKAVGPRNKLMTALKE